MPCVTRYEISSDMVTAVASELLNVVQTGPETLCWTAVAPALLAALLRGDCLSVLQSAQCTTAVANHCASLLNANSAAKNSWTDTAVVRAVLGAATGMLAADAEAASDDLHSGVAQARRPFPTPLTIAQPNRDDAARAYDAAIAAVTNPVSRTGLRSSASHEANAAVDEMALAVLSLLRTLHTLDLDCGLLSQYTIAALTAASKAAGRAWSAGAEAFVGVISPAPDPYAGWTLDSTERSLVPTQAAFLAQAITADQQSRSTQPPISTGQATNTSVAAVADALHEQGRFDLRALGGICGLPTDAAGLCAIALALDVKSGIGASRAARLAALRALCTESMVAAMVSSVPEYAQTIADLATHLRPLSCEYNVSMLLWDVLTEAESAAVAVSENGNGLTDVLRSNLYVLTQYCLLSYQNCVWDEQTALRDSYYCASIQSGNASIDFTRTPTGVVFKDADRLLMFGAPGLDSSAAASLQRATETTLVSAFNKLTNISVGDGGQDAAIWSQVGRLALVSPTLLLRKVLATVAQQPGAETAGTMLALVRRLGPAFCHYSSSSGQPSNLTCCVSLQLKSSAQKPREVSNVVEFVRRLAAVGPISSSTSTKLPQHVASAWFLELVDFFVLSHLAMNSEHLSAALQLLDVALHHVADNPSEFLICYYSPDALGCALCSLLAAGGRESLPAAELEAIVHTLALLVEAMKDAFERDGIPENCHQILLNARVGLNRYAAKLHWSVALLLHDVCGDLMDTDGRSSILAWAEGRVPTLCGQSIVSTNGPVSVEEPDKDARVVMQTLSDLLFSCALADASLQPSVELLTQLWAQHKGNSPAEGKETNLHEPARRLVTWAIGRPLELSHMTVSCVARLLPRLAQTEAKRLLCTALPKLFDGALLPEPPRHPQQLQPTGIGEEPDPISASTSFEHEQDTSVSALRIGALAAVLWLHTAYPVTFSSATDENSSPRIGRFLAAWPYSHSIVIFTGESSLPEPAPVAAPAGSVDDVLRQFALEATRHSLACLQQVCADSACGAPLGGGEENYASLSTSDAAADHLGKFTLACGLLSCSARAAGSVSGPDAGGMDSCAKTANILALNLLQGRRDVRTAQRRLQTAVSGTTVDATALAAQQGRGEWERVLLEVPKSFRGQLRKNLKSSSHDCGRSDDAAQLS